jgi:hypothetical protein
MPHEASTGKKPDVLHFRKFGCDVWVLNQKIGTKVTKDEIYGIFRQTKGGHD